MAMTLALVGAMTGIDDYNRPAFNAAAEQLRAAGFVVLNPAEYPEQENWEQYLRHSIREMLTANGIATIEGYALSRGARLELHISRKLGMPEFSWRAWIARTEFEGRAA